MNNFSQPLGNIALNQNMNMNLMLNNLQRINNMQPYGNNNNNNNLMMQMNQNNLLNNHNPSNNNVNNNNNKSLNDIKREENIEVTTVKGKSKTKDRQEYLNEIHMKNNKYNYMKPKQDYEALTNIKKIKLCLEKNLFVGALNKNKLKDHMDILERHYDLSEKKDSYCLLLDNVTKQFRGIYAKRNNENNDLYLEKVCGIPKAGQLIHNKDMGGFFTYN